MPQPGCHRSNERWLPPGVWPFSTLNGLAQLSGPLLLATQYTIDERGWNIVCAREAGVHRADLARRHGISLNRVYQIERVTRRRIHERAWQQRINADLAAEQAALMAEEARLKEQAQHIRQRRQAIQERLEAISQEMRHRLQLECRSSSTGAHKTTVT